MTVTVPGGTSVSPASSTRAARPGARHSSSKADPGRAEHLCGAAGGHPALEVTAVGSQHRGVRDLGKRLPGAHLDRRVHEVGERAGTPVVLGLGFGRGRGEGARHRLHALEQRAAFRAAPGRERQHCLAVRVAGEGVRLRREHVVPLAAAGAQHDLAGPRAPGFERLVVDELAHAADGGRAGQLAGARQVLERAAADHEVHAQRVVVHARMVAGHRLRDVSECTLITIPISHYCEKARWVLERAGIPYRERAHMQILHWLAVKRAGGGMTAPVLVTDDGRVLPESDEIVAWADDRGKLGLFPNDEVRALEHDFDERLGPEGRRWRYHQMRSRRALALKYSPTGVPAWERRMLPMA